MLETPNSSSSCMRLLTYALQFISHRPFFPSNPHLLIFFVDKSSPSARNFVWKRVVHAILAEETSFSSGISTTFHRLSDNTSAYSSCGLPNSQNESTSRPVCTTQQAHRRETCIGHHALGEAQLRISRTMRGRKNRRSGLDVQE